MTPYIHSLMVNTTLQTLFRVYLKENNIEFDEFQKMLLEFESKPENLIEVAKLMNGFEDYLKLNILNESEKEGIE